MIITELYQTKIEASSYNVNIDATDTVITVSLIDFNSAAVTGKQVVLTCDKGYFNKNCSTAISGTTTKSIIATTDSNGQITATWTASEWGLATFSTNNSNVQIKVDGWKTYRNDSYYVVLYNEDYVYFKFDYSGGSGSITTTWWELGATVFNDATHLPTNNIFFFVGNPLICNVRPDNAKIRVKSLSGTISSPFELHGEVIWRRK